MTKDAPLPHDVHIRLSDNWRARRALAEQIRRLNTALLTADVPTTHLDDIAAQLRQFADEIESQPRIYGREALIRRDGADLLYEVSPAIGQSNAASIPMHVWRDEKGHVHATFSGDWSREGPFGYLHGGVIALLFDQFLGIAQHAANTGGGRTGTLTIRYHAPTPLNAPLRMEGHLKRLDGRKKFIVAEMWSGDTRTASCEAVFVSNKPAT